MNFLNFGQRQTTKAKKQGYRNFLLSFFKERKPKELMQDVISFVKCAIEAII